MENGADKVEVKEKQRDKKYVKKRTTYKKKWESQSQHIVVDILFSINVLCYPYLSLLSLIEYIMYKYLTKYLYDWLNFYFNK